MHIPNWTYARELAQIRPQIDDAIARVLDSGHLILGPTVVRFEDQFAKVVGCKYGIGVDNGTDAIFLALKALDIGLGDEVITVANTAIPTVAAIVATGATPVFADIEPETMLINLQDIKKHITPRTKCIMPVHLYGLSCDMDSIMHIAKKHNLFVIEDCAQSTGALWNHKPTGSFGDLATHSFYPTKIIGAYGDGGMITTSSSKFEQKLRMLRKYGTTTTYYSHIHGYNSRLDELHAAMLQVKLSHLSNYIKERQNIATMYQKLLSNSTLSFQKSSTLSAHAYHLIVAQHPKRDQIIHAAAKKDIELKVHYAHPIHLMDGYAYLHYKPGHLPFTELAALQVFSLPCFIGITKEEIAYICTSLVNILQNL